MGPHINRMWKGLLGPQVERDMNEPTNKKEKQRFYIGPLNSNHITYGFPIDQCAPLPFLGETSHCSQLLIAKTKYVIAHHKKEETPKKKNNDYKKIFLLVMPNKIGTILFFYLFFFICIEIKIELI